VRTVFWEANQLKLIDQRCLPASLEIVGYSQSGQVVQAIRHMVVRGAPAIGVAAAFGLALAAQESKATNPGALVRDLEASAVQLREARPTAVNLGWAIDRMLASARGFGGDADELRRHVLNSAQQLADEDVLVNQQMARHGATLIDDGDTIIHHCNTGALAAVEWGTALGAIRMAHEGGKRIHVLVDETRPRLQGARLTAWELEQYGIPYEIITDSMAGHFLRRRQAQKVMFGADRVAANGDVVNKIGTYMLALAAADNRVPAYAVVPTSSIDLGLADGSLIPIEERDPAEVLQIEVGGERVTPEHARARNPAFDVTPNRLVSAIVTEGGIVWPPYGENLGRLRPA
jgi:methylthioribose-1-phosphate isomerase